MRDRLPLPALPLPSSPRWRALLFFSFPFLSLSLFFPAEIPHAQKKLTFSHASKFPPLSIKMLLVRICTLQFT